VPPSPPWLRFWFYAIKIGKFSENEKISSPMIMNFYSMNIGNFRTQYGVDLAQTASNANNKTFPTSTNLLFRVG